MVDPSSLRQRNNSGRAVLPLTSAQNQAPSAASASTSENQAPSAASTSTSAPKKKQQKTQSGRKTAQQLRLENPVGVLENINGALRQDVGKLRLEVIHLKKDNTGLKKQVQKLQGQVDYLGAENENLQLQLSVRSRKKKNRNKDEDDPESKAMIAKVKDYVKEKLFRTVKFVTDDDQLWEATRIVMKHIVQQYDKLSNSDIETWVGTYQEKVSQALNEKRNYAQSQMKTSGLNFQVRNNHYLPPIDLILKCATRDIDLKVAVELQCFEWYWTKLLPNAIGTFAWGDGDKYYTTISNALMPRDNSKAAQKNAETAKKKPKVVQRRLQMVLIKSSHGRSSSLSVARLGLSLSTKTVAISGRL